jgi:hypothetical protein
MGPAAAVVFDGFHYAGLPVCFLGAVMLAIGRGISGDAFTGFGATLVVGWDGH